MKTISIKAESSRNSRTSMNCTAKGIFSALKTFKRTAMQDEKMQNHAELIAGNRMAMQDLTTDDILAAQTYPIYNGEIPTGYCAKKTKNGFETKLSWTLNDLHKAFERKYSTRPFKVEKIQLCDVYVTE